MLETPVQRVCSALSLSSMHILTRYSSQYASHWAPDTLLASAPCCHGSSERRYAIGASMSFRCQKPCQILPNRAFRTKKSHDIEPGLPVKIPRERASFLRSFCIEMGFSFKNLQEAEGKEWTTIMLLVNPIQMDSSWLILRKNYGCYHIDCSFSSFDCNFSRF